MIIKEKWPLVFHGEITNMYGFTPYTLDEDFQKFEAVYIFTKRVTTKKGKQYKRLYVGETDNMATVIQDYVNSPCLRQHGVDSICIRLDADESSRCEIVRDIIDGVGGRPPCNKLWQDQTIVSALQHILEDFPNLEYDEAETKRPTTDKDADTLKIKVTDSRDIGSSVGSKIASELSKATGGNFTHPNPLNNPNPRSKRKYITIMEIPRRDRDGTPTQKGSQ